MKKILIVEDLERVQNKFSDALAGKVELLQAYTLSQAITLFIEHKETLAVIAMDACVPGDEPNSMRIVKMIRAEGFMGPMIAISSLDEYRMKLVEAGCSHECEKDRLPEQVLELVAHL